MRKHEKDTREPRCHDKQLRDVSVEAVLEKRRLGQALNAKEFSVCAGVSYSTARHWFHLPGFPIFQGVVFWEDFVHWRTNQYSQTDAPHDLNEETDGKSLRSSNLPTQAARILSDAIDGDPTTKH